MEYYSAIKKNEILPFAATWMDLAGIILSEISQTENRLVATKGRGWGRGGLTVGISRCKLLHTG